MHMKRCITFTVVFLLVGCLSLPLFAVSARDSASNQDLYDQIYRALLNKAPAFTVTSCDFDAAAAIYNLVLDDHPELFYASGDLEGSETTKSGVFESATLNFPLWDSIETRQNQVNVAARLILNATKGMDDIETAKYCYCHLITTVEYDEKTVNDQTLYGALVQHRGVCASFSKAFQYLMQQKGIECLYVTGKLKEGGDGHSWNIVKLNGQYYHVDVTSGQGGTTEDGIDMTYFGLTTKQIEKTHIIDNEYPIPDCTSFALSATRYLTSFKESDISALLPDDPLDTLSLEFSTSALYEKAAQILREDGGYKNAWYRNGVRLESITYSDDPERFILEIQPTEITSLNLHTFPSYSEKAAGECIGEAYRKGDAYVTLRYESKSSYRKAKKQLIDESGLFDYVDGLSTINYAVNDEMYGITIYFTEE